MADEAPLFKVVIIGAEGTGKTSILESFRNHKFDPAEKSSDQAKQVNIRVDLQGVNSKVNFACFDLPGKEAHMGLNRMYLRDANTALIVYDKTSRESL